MTGRVIYMVMRHGEAVPVEEAGSDEARWLTEKGRREVELVARLLPARPSVVFSSPYTRARETAEIVARTWGVGVVVVEELAPRHPRCKPLERLLSPSPGALIVGHNPDMEELLCCLIGGGDVHLEPGAVAVLEAEGWGKKKARLVELITPGLAERARRAWGGGE